MGPGREFFRIRLEHPPGAVYSPGSDLLGNLTVVNDKVRSDIKYISLEFKGAASVSWSEQESYTETRGVGADARTETKTRTVWYSGNEIYFSHKVILFGSKSSGRKPTLEAGTVNFPFSFQLPSNLPSSFDGGCGRVQYAITAKGKRDFLSSNKTLVHVFRIHNPLDLNLEPFARKSETVEKHKSVGCLWWKSGPIRIRMTLDKCGYVPGENILLRAELFNESKSNIGGVSIKLVQITKFHATSKTRIEGKTICTWTGVGAMAGETEMWQLSQGKVPILPPSRLDNCRIIDISYELQIKTDIREMTRNLRLSFPLIIGTIPLTNSLPYMDNRM